MGIRGHFAGNTGLVLETLGEITAHRELFLAAEGDAPVVVVCQEILGHASTRTTQKYSHVTKRATEDAMEEVFGDSD